MEDFEDNDENADNVEIPDAPKEEIKVLDLNIDLKLVPEQQEVAAVEENAEIAVEAPKAAEVEAVAS